MTRIYVVLFAFSLFVSCSDCDEINGPFVSDPLPLDTTVFMRAVVDSVYVEGQLLEEVRSAFFFYIEYIDYKDEYGLGILAGINSPFFSFTSLLAVEQEGEKLFFELDDKELMAFFFNEDEVRRVVKILRNLLPRLYEGEIRVIDMWVEMSS